MSTELDSVVAELMTLAEKPHQTPAEKRKFAALQTKAAALRTERRQATYSREAEVRMWRDYIHDEANESRDMIVGNGTPAYLDGNLGSFVPLTTFDRIFAAKKNTDALFNPDVVTFIQTDNARPSQVPLMGDTENVATLISEAGTTTETDIWSTSGAMIGGYAFRSPVFHASIEAFQDVQIGGSLLDRFTAFSADRIARGVGPYLVTGSGPAASPKQPFGLLTALEALGGANVISTGSSANPGSSSNTAANSIGSADIANLYYALDEAYRDSPKCAWLMSSGTLGNLAAIVSKQGLPVVQWQGPEAWILGKPVRISPSMPSIASAACPIVFGDLSYFLVRATPVKVIVYKEYPGLVENGKVGFEAIVRYDSALMFSDTGSPSPCVYLANHS